MTSGRTTATSRRPRDRAHGTPLNPDGHGPHGPVLVIRPRRIRRAAWACAVALVAAFAAIASVLRNSDTGVVFRFADQVALVSLGVLFAAAVLLLARPRVRADAEGVEVRNTGWPRYLPWEVVRAVSFPDGASWARLDLPDHEYVPVLAVQAADGQRAVEAIRGLRALHAAAHAGLRTGDPGDTGPGDAPGDAAPASSGGAGAGQVPDDAPAAGTDGGTPADGTRDGSAASGDGGARPGRT